MRRPGAPRARLLAAAALGAVALSLAACASPARPQRHEIAITGFAFTPREVEVRPGDTLVFENRDAVPHTATGANGAWDTGDLPAGGRRVVVVPADGAGPYRCAYHPTMTGALAYVR
jgi:plastocyanin